MTVPFRRLIPRNVIEMEQVPVGHADGDAEFPLLTIRVNGVDLAVDQLPRRVQRQADFPRIGGLRAAVVPGVPLTAEYLGDDRAEHRLRDRIAQLRAPPGKALGGNGMLREAVELFTSAEIRGERQIGHRRLR